MSPVVSRRSSSFGTPQIDPSDVQASPGLDRITGTQPSDPARAPPPIGSSIGTPSDASGLKAITSALADPARAPRSPFPDRARTTSGVGQPRANLKPQPDWLKAVREAKVGWTIRRRQPDQAQSSVLALAAKLKAGGRESGADPDMRSVQIARNLHASLNEPHDGTDRPAAMRKAILVVKAAVGDAADRSSPNKPRDLLRGILLLRPADRELLLQADKLSGGKLVKRLAHLAKDGEAGPIHARFKSEVGVAQLALSMDEADPSGLSSAALRTVLDHVEELGTSEKVLVAFQNHLAFQGRIGDLAVPTGAEDPSRQALTASLLSRFAALEEVPRGDVVGLLKSLPKGDVVALIGHALVAPTEGDVHLLRAFKTVLAEMPNVMGADAAKFSALFAKLERNALDPAVLIAECAKGSSVDAIETALNEAASKEVDQALATCQKQLDTQVSYAKARLLLTSDSVEIAMLNDAIRQFDSRKLTRDEIAGLADRFGISTFKNITTYTLKPTDSNFKQQFRTNIDSIRQLAHHIEALTDSSKLEKGLQNFIPVLPTSGKVLENFHFVESMVDDLVTVADTIKADKPGFNLSRNPIVIIDQSDASGPSGEALWDRNEAYLKGKGGLQDKYADRGLRIEHVSMAQIRKMIAGTNIEKLFDTTREGNPGYGGARNIAFLLGSVIAKVRQAGESIDTIKPDALVDLIKTHALGPSAPNIFMGDDTDYLRPGAMYAKTGLNALYGGEYHTVVSRRDGRDTTGVSSSHAKATTPKVGVPDPLLTKAFANSKLMDRPRNGGMGCASGGPRFCFDIPTGAEEGQHKAAVTHTDQFSRVSHLSGDRMKAFDRQVADYLNYSLGTELFKGLTHGDTASAVMPWNDKLTAGVRDGKPPYDSLGPVFAEAAKPEVAKAAQTAFLANLGGWIDKAERGNGGPFDVSKDTIDNVRAQMRANPQMDPELRSQYQAVIATYEDVIRQANVIHDFGRRFLDDLAPKAKGLKGGDLAKARQDAFADLPPGRVKAAFAATRKATIDAANLELRAGKNQVIRDFLLIVESLGTGGFADMAAKFA